MGYQKKRIEPLITEKKKFDQIGHAVLELSSIEKLLTGVFRRRRSPFSKIIFLKNFGWIRKVLSQLDQHNLVCSNRINGNRYRAYLNSRKTTFRHETVKNAHFRELKIGSRPVIVYPI